MDLAELGMCTKVTLEGIPEWSALKDVCSSLAYICRGPSATYASLEEQLKLKGISSRDQDGLRVSKETLRSRLRRCGHKVSMATKQRKRKSANVHELRKRVLRGGGNPRPTIDKRRCPWGIEKLKRWLRARGMSTV